MDGATFSLTLPSELRMLSVARNFVEAVCEAYQLNRSIAHALIIVTGEAITNIVRHAHRNRCSAQMEMHLHLFPDCIHLIFKDEGEPFDLASVPQLPPGELRIGGRGIYLMRTLMDEVTYQPREEGQTGNMLRMIKRCSVSGGARACG
jgi:serine/threonine-protein kinase RsbW